MQRKWQPIGSRIDTSKRNYTYHRTVEYSRVGGCRLHKLYHLSDDDRPIISTLNNNECSSVEPKEEKTAVDRDKELYFESKTKQGKMVNY